VYDHLRELQSFPTRRSSDLRTLEEATSTRLTPAPWVVVARRLGSPLPALDETVGGQADQRQYEPTRRRADQRGDHRSTSTAVQRSEEHTSELQSRFDLVCRL